MAKDVHEKPASSVVLLSNLLGLPGCSLTSFIWKLKCAENEGLVRGLFSRIFNVSLGSRVEPYL